MGKSNNKGNKSKAAAAAATAPKCTCDHPYQCSCGNRPERPSKGHKWYPEEQIWAGKGHKQKGASGQTASIGQEAVVTAKGQTAVAQWQRLPSQLLQDYCQRQKRPRPKYKNIESKTGVFKYRVILNDPKGDDAKDLFFVPAKSVPNEEQAKEEGALLALLQLAPQLPHERKLPEPYRTTWLNAVAAASALASSSSKAKAKASAQQQSKKQSAATDASTTITTKKNATTNKNSNSHASSSAAVASTNLTLGVSAVSFAERRRQRDEQRRQRNARIHRHDALRLANQNHPVFMSAAMRRQIERLLRGDNHDNSTLLELDNDNDDNDNDDDDDESVEEDPANDDVDDAQIYVEHRLHSEGFTKRQARTAYNTWSHSSDNATTTTKTADNNAVDNEDVWDDIYEQCLQWLLVHLNEDQLPEGFDPRGRMLDVIVPSSSVATTTQTDGAIPSNSGNGGTAGTLNTNNAASLELASFLSITVKEAKLIGSRSHLQKDKDQSSPLDVFWQIVQRAAGGAPGNDAAATEMDETTTLELVQDEREALEAIFADDCKFNSTGRNGTTVIQLPLQGGDLTLAVAVQDKMYPHVHPSRVIVSGKQWPSSSKIGAALHVELCKFVQELPMGEPMIFALHAHAQDFLLSNELTELSLLSLLGGDDSKAQPTEPSVTSMAVANGAPANSPSSAKRAAPSSSSAAANDSRTAASSSSSNNNDNNKTRLPQRRPRVRGRNFWSIRPRDTPPATAFPKVGAAMEHTRKSLPAAQTRSEFLGVMKKAMSGNRVVLVTGETGSGKSTQLPAYILENDPGGAKIVVAQPRRLAATGVANRVAEERGEQQAGTGSVGYVVRGDSAMCNRTRLMFCTTGVLLRQLQNEGALECVTHIVVDEVHERQLESDVLLGFLRQCLSIYPNLCVILMSATMDSEKFERYFGASTPHIHIPGRTFPVSDQTLEDVLTMTGYIPPKKNRKGKSSYAYSINRKKSSPWNDSEVSDGEGDTDDEGGEEKDLPVRVASNTPLEVLLKRIDETVVNADLICRLVGHLVRNKKSNDDGSILVFLPGAPEINGALETIKRGTRDLALMLLPLHGGLQPKEQSRVFQRPPNGFTKVVLSTNVAETSITIPDCTVVIDCCREKQASYDPVNRMPLLVEQFASKASLKQRRGRAGRVREGTCYKLVSRATFAALQDHSEPEIRRVALDQTLLQLLFLGVENGSGTFMRTLLDPPSRESLDAAAFSLNQLGAVEQGTSEGQLQLTPLGSHLAGIPAPPIVGKMVVMGSILGCRSAALAMAAGISLGRSPFFRIDAPRKRQGDDEEISMEDFKRRRVLEERSKYFKSVGNSDHAILAALFLKWKGIGAGGGERKAFCDSLGLSFTGMRDMLQLANQLDGSLKAAGFVPTAESDQNGKSWRIIHSCAVSAMAPGQLVKVRRPAAKYSDTAEGAKAKDGEARELKFFIRLDNGQEERVFIHPSSANFSNGDYSCPFLVYNSMVRTSKPFLRDVTECSAYSLLLFGGKLEVKSSKGTIVIDGWAELSANARIGSLMGGLRRRVDTLMAEKVRDPSIDIAGSQEMQLIVKLIVSDGLGTG